MRKLLHNLIDFIFDFLYHSLNHIKCLFRKPEYKIGLKFKMNGEEHTIVKFFKDYKWDNIFYETDKTKNFSYSEGIVYWYVEGKGKNE